MRILLLKRICYSFASGRASAENLLHGDVPEEDEGPLLAEIVADLRSVEITSPRSIIEDLSSPELATLSGSGQILLMGIERKQDLAGTRLFCFQSVL
jgi:hypothetical protein